jgi:hypothetical protein
MAESEDLWQLHHLHPCRSPGTKDNQRTSSLKHWSFCVTHNPCMLGTKSETVDHDRRSFLDFFLLLVLFQVSVTRLIAMGRHSFFTARRIAATRAAACDRLQRDAMPTMQTCLTQSTCRQEWSTAARRVTLARWHYSMQYTQ